RRDACAFDHGIRLSPSLCAGPASWLQSSAVRLPARRRGEENLAGARGAANNCAWLHLSGGNGPFDTLHVRIGEAKVVTDLMYQNVRDQMAERFVALRPIVEQGAPIEKHHVGGLRYVHHAFPIKADALIEPHQVERAFD